MKKAHFIIVCALSIATLLIALPALTYDPNLDADGNQFIDDNDLYYFMEHWHTGPGSAETETPTAQTATPTPTPTATEAAAETPTPTQTQSSGNNILSMPTLIPVGLTEIIEGGGSYSGNVSIPVKLSNVAGLTQAELLFNNPLATDSDYLANITGVSLTGLVTEDWTIEEITEGIQGGWRISGPALVGTGYEETILSVTATVMNLSTPPPEDRVLELDFYQTDLTGAGPWDAAKGSLLINPSGSTLPTSTPTATHQAGDTPTPTATHAQSGDVEKLQLSACKTQEFAGNQVLILVDQLNDAGQIVNPGVEGGAPARDVTISLTGPAVFAGIEQTQTTTSLDYPAGVNLNVEGTGVGQVQVNASSDGVGGADTLTIDFVEGGNISGLIRLPDTPGGALRPANPGEATIDVFESATGNFVTRTAVGMEGVYETPYIAAGLYDVSVEPNYYLQTQVDGTIGNECIQGVQVVGGQTTENTDADLAFLTGGARVFGDITVDDGGDLPEAGAVTLVPQDYPYCGLQTFFVMISTSQPGSATYEIQNVPEGTYHTIASGQRTNPTEDLSSLTPISLDVPASGELQQDLVLSVYESYELTMDSPINYQRVASPPSFSWTLVEDPGKTLIYTLSAGNRCEYEFWMNDSVDASPAVYDGTRTLVPNEIYRWSVTGFSEDGTISVTPQFQQGNEYWFLVE